MKSPVSLLAIALSFVAITAFAGEPAEPRTTQRLADGGNNYKRGTGWYRLRITPQAALVGRRGDLRFDGVRLVSSVWLNGKDVGGHSSAYSAAGYDVTDLLKPGKNLLVVCADNSFNPDVPPQSLSLSGSQTSFPGKKQGPPKS